MLALWQTHEQRFTWLKSLPYLGYSNLAALPLTVTSYYYGRWCQLCQLVGGDFS